MRGNLGGLLLEDPGQLPFGMFGSQDRRRYGMQRRFGSRIDREIAHIRHHRKFGTNVASFRIVATEFFPATRGAGPLLQRDYWAVLDNCPLKPSELMTLVKEQFCSLPPSSLVQFVAPHGVGLGSLIDIVIMPGRRCGVRVINEDQQSITFATLEGHPEAGRITFGSYRNPAGDVLFHIRSRARSGTALQRLGFLLIGDAMQTTTWTDFINNVALLAGTTIAGVVHADTQHVDEEAEDDEPLRAPTYLAVGD